MNATDRRLVDLQIQEAAREAAFKLEIAVMREDHQDRGVSAHTLSQMIVKLARQYHFDPWFVRALVEEVWKDDVGHGVLNCNVCGDPYSSHPIGHCPDLNGEPVLMDGPSKRTLQRRELRAKT